MPGDRPCVGQFSSLTDKTDPFYFQRYPSTQVVLSSLGKLRTLPEVPRELGSWLLWWMHVL